MNWELFTAITISFISTTVILGSLKSIISTYMHVEPSEFEKGLADIVENKSKYNWESQEFSWEVNGEFNRLKEMDGKLILNGVHVGREYLSKGGVKLLNKAILRRMNRCLTKMVKV